jgi:hypothetical protein
MMPHSLVVSYETSLVVIFGILGGLLIFGRKLRGLPWPNTKLPKSAISISSIRSVGAQNALAIAEVEGHRFLIAIGRNGISKIGRLDTPANLNMPTKEL